MAKKITTQKRAKRQGAADLYLWHVGVEYDKYLADRGSTTLRITTATHSIEKAIARARAHVKKNKHDWPGAKFESVELQGRIAT